MARRLIIWLAPVATIGCNTTLNDVGRNILLPEQESIRYRTPDQLPPAPIPATAPPRTVSNPQPDTAPWQLSLDDALRIALENARVIRVLAGTSAVSTGRTIYDTAITNTTIDQQQGRFDPVLSQGNTWNHTDTPFAVLSPLDPSRSFLTGTQRFDYRNDLGLSQTNLLGGQSALRWIANPTRFDASGLPLNPQAPHNVELSYAQPLLQGAGFRVNAAPIVIARLNTEQSFFQYKDTVQELVRGVTEGYWNLVQARVNVWARGIQVQQSKSAYEREEARLKTGFGDAGTVSQARVLYNQFAANKVAADADLLNREAALRNLLYLPPTDDRQIIPTSAPASQRLSHDWDALVRLAEQRRPDLVELKIVLEADRVRRLQAENQALPKLDAVASYRWNGLNGTMPNGERLASGPGQFTDWTVGVNFSVPLGLRQGRAQVRQQDLLIARDRANLDQGLHAAIHELAAVVRDLDSAYAQYRAFKETRAAADINLRVQNEKFRAGQTIYLNVLQALNDWGNAVSSEAQSLLIYNIALATLERRTGTILETHGLVFYEERFRAAGPLPFLDRSYPSALPPAGTSSHHPGSGGPAEDSFDLQNPTPRDENAPKDVLPKPKENLPLPKEDPPQPKR